MSVFVFEPVEEIFDEGQPRHILLFVCTGKFLTFVVYWFYRIKN